MGARKGHERLENCICEWHASPIDVSVVTEELSKHDPRVYKGTEYSRQIRHVINPECVPHGYLLHTSPVLRLLPKVSNIAVEAVPLANRPVQTMGEWRDRAEELTREILVEENGRVQRKEVPIEPKLGHDHKVYCTHEPTCSGRLAPGGISRERYEARASSDFFTPLDDPKGEGHCRSCHHVCEYEDCRNKGVICQEPTCGHWIGCPGC